MWPFYLSDALDIQFYKISYNPYFSICSSGKKMSFGIQQEDQLFGSMKHKKHLSSLLFIS